MLEILNDRVLGRVDGRVLFASHETAYHLLLNRLRRPAECAVQELENHAPRFVVGVGRRVRDLDE